MQLAKDVYLPTLSKLHEKNFIRPMARGAIYAEGTRDRTRGSDQKQTFDFGSECLKRTAITSVVDY